MSRDLAGFGKFSTSDMAAKRVCSDQPAIKTRADMGPAASRKPIISAAANVSDFGARFGVTRERIRQIEAKVLRELRHPSRADRLRSFLVED